MVNIIIGIIFIVIGLIFFKLVGDKAGIVMMIICGVLGIIILISAFIPS